jgi:protein transport protein SEC9
MGFLKKKDDDGDSNRSALFGRKDKSKSPAPPTDNPYAQNAIPADPYTRAKMNAGVAQAPTQTYQGGPPQPSQGGYGGMSRPSDPRGGYGGGGGYGGDNKYGGGSGYNDNKYGGGASQGGYAPDKYAQRGGYGDQGSSNPYGAPQPSGVARSGGGGYGGLGRTASYDDQPDANRDQLFGGARERIEQRQQQQPGGPPDYAYNNEDRSGADTSYGAYGDRQLTAEEEEEEDITATKSEIKFMKQQDVASTRNALRIAAQAEETGRNTLARLGAQGERMHNTDRNLDIANNQINISEDKQAELRKLNRSMFAVHVNNPFNAKQRQMEKDEKIMTRHRLEREQREATREQAFKAGQRMNQNFKDMEGQGGYGMGPTGIRKTKNLAERSKYQFEADSDDDRAEDEIDNNLDQLSHAAGRLNLLAKATGQEIEQQNQLIERIGEKVRLYLDDNMMASCVANKCAERQVRRPDTLADGEAQAHPLSVKSREHCWHLGHGVRIDTGVVVPVKEAFKAQMIHFALILITQPHTHAPIRLPHGHRGCASSYIQVVVCGAN